MRKLFMLLLALPLAFGSCSDDNTDIVPPDLKPAPEETPEPNQPEVATNVLENTYWFHDGIGVTEIKTDSDASAKLVEAYFVTNAVRDSYSIWYGADGVLASKLTGPSDVRWGTYLVEGDVLTMTYADQGDQVGPFVLDGDYLILPVDYTSYYKNPQMMADLKASIEEMIQFGAIQNPSDYDVDNLTIETLRMGSKLVSREKPEWANVALEAE